MSLNNLPVRLAATAAHPPPLLPSLPESHERGLVSPDTNLALVGDAGEVFPVLPSLEAAEDGAVIASLSPEPLQFGPGAAAAAAGGPTNHQFWLKDAKIAEDLFTVRSHLVFPSIQSQLTLHLQIHRSAKHLAEFVCTCRREIAPPKMSMRQLVLVRTNVLSTVYHHQSKLLSS